MSAAAEPKIFKKIEVVEGGGHHGGGWKVAYADFMTAMMAFFLLMWILASSDEQKLRGIAEYFTTATLPGGSGVLDGATLGPPGTLTASNGNVVARGSELGKNDATPVSQWEVKDVTETTQAEEVAFEAMPKGDGEEEAAPQEKSTALSDGHATENEAVADHSLDDQQFERLQADILQAMQDNPDLAPLKQNLIFEQTPEGLHIQIIDQDGKPMFHSGQAKMTAATQTLLSNLGQSLSALPNRIILAGHTDSVPFADSSAYDNWDLSTDRANATRKIFETSGVARDRIIRVSGMADTDPLVPSDTTDASNRRISVKVQYRDAGDDPTGSSSAPMVQEAANRPGNEATGVPKAKHQRRAEKAAGMGVTNEKHVSLEAPLEQQVFQNLRNALR